MHHMMHGKKNFIIFYDNYYTSNILERIVIIFIKSYFSITNHTYESERRSFMYIDNLFIFFFVIT